MYYNTPLDLYRPELRYILQFSFLKACPLPGETWQSFLDRLRQAPGAGPAFEFRLWGCR